MTAIAAGPRPEERAKMVSEEEAITAQVNAAGRVGQGVEFNGTAYISQPMPNRRLSAEERGKADELLANIRKQLDELSGGDRDLRFAYNRKIAKELGYDERGKPMARRKLKREKRQEQNHQCAECGKEMPLEYSVLDRRNAVDGYTKENTRLVHSDCDYKTQAAKGYT